MIKRVQLHLYCALIQEAGIIAVIATHRHWTVNHNVKHTSSTYTIYNPDQSELTSKVVNACINYHLHM